MKIWTHLRKSRRTEIVWGFRLRITNKDECNHLSQNVYTTVTFLKFIFLKTFVKVTFFKVQTMYAMAIYLYLIFCIALWKPSNNSCPSRFAFWRSYVRPGDLKEMEVWTHLRKSRRTEIVEGFQLCSVLDKFTWGTRGRKGSRFLTAEQFLDKT